MAKKSILTIENCSAISFLMDTVLGKDYSVTSVNDCSNAFNHLQEDVNKDVIILDIPHADSENFELLQHIHTSAVLKNIRTVVISNSDDETLKNKTVELGASLFLTKPFDPVYLSEKLKNLVDPDGKINPSKKRYFNLNIF